METERRLVKCECVILCVYGNSLFDLCPLGSPPPPARPEGTRMIQVMLLKSLVQVGIQDSQCV